MLKKIILFLLIFFLSFFSAWAEGDENRCAFGGTNNISCPNFTIDPSTFTPWNWELLEEAKKWNWDLVKTSNVILERFIKYAIVLFWVLSLLMMTIGWAMMIFLSSSETYLTRWKGVFIWWLISLAIALSSGIIVQLVSYFLY